MMTQTRAQDALRFLVACSLLLSACAGTGARQEISAQTAVPATTPKLVSSGLDQMAMDAAFERADAALDSIAAVPDADRTFDNTVRAVDDVIATLFSDVRFTGFMSSVHPDEDVRALGETTSTQLSNWWVELNMHEGVFAGLVAYAGTKPELSGPEQRFLDESLRDYRRAGMGLTLEKREELKALEFEITEVEQDFKNNIRDDESVVMLTAEELAGLPEDVLEIFPRSGEMYIVPMKGTYIRPIFLHCPSSETREKVSITYSRRAGKANVRVLEQILKLRAKKAELLDYDTIADYATETRMAENPATVMAFYEELRPKLRAKAQADWNEYTAAKREYTGNPDAELTAWDNSFTRNYLMRTKYSVDTSKVQEYFPIDRVVGGIFDLTQTIFGVEYREVTDKSEERGRPLWHADVKLYEVWDKATGALLGEFYTDLHPRDNKYGHAAQFPLVLRKRWTDGSLTTPVVALVCNFTKPTADKPSLLTHSEVETFFHEFGHCLHSIFSEADLASQAGTNVARDFVEAPSQMLENWIWDRGVLAQLGGHYETGEALPDEILDGMLAAKNLGSGTSAEYQVYLGLLDMTLHTAPGGEIDSTETNQRIAADARMIGFPENTFNHGAFGHLVGYEAGYYGYLWSLVYAQDMFTYFDEHGLMNPEAGMTYRKKVLSKGGTVPALDLVRDFLGREPNSSAFLEHLGLDGSN